ncbi:uncharacterized [Tachysurus ichikawai]
MLVEPIKCPSLEYHVVINFNSKLNKERWGGRRSTVTSHLNLLHNDVSSSSKKKTCPRGLELTPMGSSTCETEGKDELFLGSQGNIVFCVQAPGSTACPDVLSFLYRRNE